MRQRERDLDPQVKRELDALDAAIRGERVDPDLEGLAGLVSELREARPKASEEFNSRLDAAAAEGFPSAAPAVNARKRRTMPSFSTLMPRIAVAASILVALVIGVSFLSNTDSGSDDSGLATPDNAHIQSLDRGAAGDASTESGTQESLDDSTAAAPGVAAPPSPGPVELATGGPQLKPGQERIQEQSASMALSTEPDEVDDVADGVVDVVDRYDGIVVSSDVNTSEGKGRAAFDLRIPTQNLAAALADVSDLASVTNRDEGSRDITAPFISAEETFADAKAEVDALLGQLAEAGSTAEIDAIKARLAVARPQLATARTALADLKQRADYSHLSVTVTGDGDSDGWSIGDAINDAGSVLEAIGGALLVGLAAIIPAGAILILASLGLRQYRRRRREGALDD